MMMMNYVETITILLCKQIDSNSFKNEITDKLMHVNLFSNYGYLVKENET